MRTIIRICFLVLVVVVSFSYFINGIQPSNYTVFLGIQLAAIDIRYELVDLIKNNKK